MECVLRLVGDHIDHQVVTTCKGLQSSLANQTLGDTSCLHEAHSNHGLTSA